MSNQNDNVAKRFRMEWWNRAELEDLRRCESFDRADQFKLMQLTMYGKWK